MSQVYLAQQRRLRRLVALKVMATPPGSGDSSWHHRFRIEARTLAQLDHPNVVVVHDYGQSDDGLMYLVMEFVDGPSLHDLLRGGPLDLPTAMDIGLQICAGLRHAHNRNVIHRDLKPANILVRRNDDGSEQVKIVDFGLGKILSADPALTRPGVIIGSAPVMSPEQAQGLKVDTRSDVYSLGVVLFRMLTGRYPFPGRGLPTILAHITQEVPSFSQVAPRVEVPAELENLVLRCLEKRREDRLQTVQDVIDGLLPFSGRGYSVHIASLSRDSLVKPVPVLHPSPRGWSPLIPAIVAGSLAALALLAVLGVLLTKYVEVPAAAPERPAMEPLVAPRPATPVAAPSKPRGAEAAPPPPVAPRRAPAEQTPPSRPRPRAKPVPAPVRPAPAPRDLEIEVHGKRARHAREPLPAPVPRPSGQTADPFLDVPPELRGD